ncbi:MAG: endopeptidase La [Vulcanimicrobiota bacterium]
MSQRQPLVAVRNTVMFPHGVLPITVARPRSRAAIEAAFDKQDGTLVVFAQKDPQQDSPEADDLFTIGTRVRIQRVVKSHSHFEVLLQGIERVRLLDVTARDGYLEGEVETLPTFQDEGLEIEALGREVIEVSTQVLELSGQSRGPLAHLAAQLDDPVQLAYFLAPALGLPVDKCQAVLEASSRQQTLERLLEFLRFELEVLGLQKQINSQTREQLGKEQKQAILRRQLEAIRKEMGDGEDEQAEAELLRERLEQLDLSEEVHKEIERELKRLERTPSNSPDYQVARTYLELVLDLPWKESTEDNLDLARARQVLDEDHHGLEEIKERILEHLAVMKLNAEAKAPILLFVGPPGVGKTSLGQSIARSLGRKFERLSLGGLHDEAELRGHRRTYIGAMPGRLIQALRRAGSKNPVLMLDEIDKLGRGFRGDPAAALLEVIDPAQNDKFRDNYLDLPFDLSKVMFILTANSLDTIPEPLLDRMEVIHLSGYSQEEKLGIARRYLVPRRLREAGLAQEQVTVLKEALNHLIARYTREAGVRNLERALGKVARKLALRYSEQAQSFTLDVALVQELLGPETFSEERVRQRSDNGVATGLAWTRAGGDILYIESLLIAGGKGLTLTGQLGEVMSESAQAAQSYILSKAREFRIPERSLRESGVHIHVPAGAIPKDGPSAGVTMAVSLASAYTGIAVRPDVAMTGEITLTGLVLPVGGIKEKVLAARRSGITTVILPRDNERDLAKLPDHIRAEMEFVLADRIEEVLEVAAPEIARRLAREREALLAGGVLN